MGPKAILVGEKRRTRMAIEQEKAAVSQSHSIKMRSNLSNTALRKLVGFVS